MSTIQTIVDETENITNSDKETIIKLNEDDDLEDGEIDDSDDDENNVNVNYKRDNKSIASNKNEHQQKKQHEKSGNVETIDLSSDNTLPQPSALTLSTKLQLQPQQVTRSKQPTLVEDDHASNIQNALANVLKKKGIEPTLPKVLENRLQQLHQDSGCSASGCDDNETSVSQGQSRSSRRRKRKKQREEKEQFEKEKNRNKEKKMTQTTVSELPPPSDNDDVDDYELLNVRGGSPAPITNLSLTTPVMSSTATLLYENNIEDDNYQSDEDSNASSYDTYNSEDDGNLTEKRRKRRHKKETRKRRERRNREDASLISSSLRRQEKRARRESLDEKHRNEPRKLELCKFYLMECCAKKDKCSYMHSDFPCKYYYLGMDCAYKDDCKFAHSEPLSEELRNILLKHLETAPKEILGSFKRISRESAVSMITRRHEELCVKFNVQNIWAPFTANSLPQHPNRRNNNNNKGLNDSQYQVQQPTNTTTTSNIPSLLDLVIKPPINMDLNCPNNSNNNINNDTIGGNSTNNTDKQRKSRWTDNNINTKANVSVEPPSKAPSYLDLKNLTNILSNDHIQKLLSMGINNLEQVNQLTFGQLNQIGLTIAEISEIQVKAMNVDKAGNNNITATLCSAVTTAIKESSLITDSQYLGGKMSKITGNNSDCTVDSITAPSTNTSGDVDMRFLPSIDETLDVIQKPTTVALINNNNNINDHTDCDTTTITPTPTSSTASERAKTFGNDNVENEKDNWNSHSNSNSNSSCGVIMVDYSQYLKDSHISFDRSDIYDDEKDDEQLVIDDPNFEHEESVTHRNTSNTVYDTEQPSESYNVTFASKFNQITDIGNALRNPFNNSCSPYKQDAVKITSDSIKGNMENAENFYNDNEASYYSNSDCQQERNFRRSCSRSRSRSRTPPLRSQSSTPEASQSPKPFDQMRFESKEIVYERPSMYDYCARIAEEDEAKAALRLKSDKDMRFLPASESTSGLSDIDLRLPFQPITNYTPATEIDGSITSHLPMTYKVHEVDVARASYLELRQHFKSDHTTDPRLRRILGLPELSPTKTTVALSRKVRKSSHCSSIASPSESEDASPKYYTPPPSQHLISNVVTTANAISNSGSGLRGDPRRNFISSNGGGDPRRNLATVSKTNSPNPNGANIVIGVSSDAMVIPPNSSGGQKQNVEIRNLLQKSEWYKNLNSKFKIMVNQQLALVSTELKKFHQNPSPNKIFDISFIVNNSTLQQILTNLGIYIDDNGEVAYVEGESDTDSHKEGLQVRDSTKTNSITLPNLSQPPPNTLGGSSTAVPAPSTCSAGGIGNGGNNATLEFLKAPPPNIIAAAPPSINLAPMFQRPPALQVPLFGRPSLLGLPPTHFNPFAANIPELNVAPNANFLGPNAAANLLGAAFANLPAALQQQQQRNFNTPRNQRNRRLI